MNDQLNKGKRRFYFAVPQLLPKTLVKGENDMLNYNATLQDLHLYTVTLFLVKLVLSKLQDASLIKKYLLAPAWPLLPLRR